MIEPGTKLTRYISSERIPMEMTVEKVEDGIIYCKGGWTFDAVCGFEIDEDLNWGVQPDGKIVTGSIVELGIEYGPWWPDGLPNGEDKP